MFTIFCFYFFSSFLFAKHKCRNLLGASVHCSVAAAAFLDKTYNVFGGMLNLAQPTNLQIMLLHGAVLYEHRIRVFIFWQCAVN